LEAQQHLDGALDHLVLAPIVQASDSADAARIVLKRGVVKARGLRSLVFEHVGRRWESVTPGRDTPLGGIGPDRTTIVGSLPVARPPRVACICRMSRVYAANSHGLGDRPVREM